MPDPISTSIYFKFATGWLQQLGKSLTRIRQERRKEIARAADIFGDPSELARLYIEPDCQQFNPSDDLEDDVVREPVFSRIERFFSKEKIHGNQLFVLSDAGMGKTSLLIMLYLGHVNAFWPSGLECKLLKLGPRSDEEIAEIAGKSRTVLLLDALDEDPTAWGRTRERLIDILKITQTFRRAIITCRTQFFAAGREPFNRRGQVEVGGFLCPVAFLSLFDDSQVRRYLKKRFLRDEGSIEEATALLAKMGSLRMRPMLLAHIEDLLESETEEWNEYLIYDALVSAWLLREQRKVLDRRGVVSPTKADLLAVCRRIASELHTSAMLTVSETRLKEILARTAEAKHLQTMDIGGRSLLNKNSDGDYRFSHYSIQEFLIIEGVVGNCFLQQRSPFRATEQMIKFLRRWLQSSTKPARQKARLALLDLSKCNLADQTLSYMNLREARFNGADLTGADLSSSDASDALLMYARLDGATLTGTTLADADLSGASLRAVKLDGAVLTRSRMAKADLTEVLMKGSILVGADARGANLRGGNLQNASLKHCDLQGVVLAGADLSRADLSGADLSDADLDRTKLGDAILSLANLERASIRGTDLRRTDLAGANLRQTSLRNSNLQRVSLREHDLTGTDFSHANLEGAILAGAKCRGALLERAQLAGADLSGADLEGASMRAVDLKGVILEKTVLRRVDFENAILDDLDLSGWKLEACRFVGASLRGVVLAKCSLGEADFKAADLRRCRLSGAGVDGARFEGADLREAKLDGVRLGTAQLRGAILDGHILDSVELERIDLSQCRMRGISLRKANLRNANLREADLSSANLSGADLSGADLRESILINADLRGALLKEARLEGANLTGANLEDAVLDGVLRDDTTIWSKNRDRPDQRPVNA